MTGTLVSQSDRGGLLRLSIHRCNRCRQNWMGLQTLMYRRMTSRMAEDFQLPFFNQFVHIFLEFHQLLGKERKFNAIMALRAVGLNPRRGTRSGCRVKADGLNCGCSQYCLSSVPESAGSAQLHALLAAGADEIVLGALFDVFQHLAQLLAQGRRDDGRRSFVGGTQPVGVRGAGMRLQPIRCDGMRPSAYSYESDETQVLFRRVLPGAWSRIPVSVPGDGLLCLPLPLTPLKGFSCSSTRKPGYVPLCASRP